MLLAFAAGIAFFYQGGFVMRCFAFFFGATSLCFKYVTVIKMIIRYGMEGA